MRFRSIAGLMLAHRLRRCPHIKAKLDTPLVFVGKCGPSKEDMLIQCWFNVGPPSATLAQLYTTIFSIFHVCREWMSGNGMASHPFIVGPIYGQSPWRLQDLWGDEARILETAGQYLHNTVANERSNV